MFISFEGIDGSGKSTQVTALVQALEQRGATVCQVREPGGTPLGEAIRSLLLDVDNEINGRSELLLFSAARAQLVSDVIRPALARGEVVVADRFLDSTTAYQGAGRELASSDWLSEFHQFVTDGCVPDKTYLLDLAPGIAAARTGARSVSDRMEQSGEEFFQRVTDGYHSAAVRSPDRIVVLDATQPPDRLHEQILHDLRRGQKKGSAFI